MLGFTPTLGQSAVATNAININIIIIIFLFKKIPQIPKKE
jgi:hypothetical protein